MSFVRTYEEGDLFILEVCLPSRFTGSLERMVVVGGLRLLG